MPLIRIAHPDLSTQKTYTTAEVAAAATSATVENNDDFGQNDLALFGKFGQEKSEIVTITSITGSTTLNFTGGVTFAHGTRTPVYEILYNQAEIYRANSEGGTYSLVATVSLNVDEEDTVYNDTAGDSGKWYKYRYKNSVTTTYSDYSVEVQGSGFTTDSLASMVDEVLESFGDADAKGVSKEQVERHLNSGVRRFVIKIIQAFPDYFGAYDTQSLSASTTYSYPTRFIAFQRVQIGSSVTNSYPVTFEKESDLDPTLTYLESDPKIVLRDATWKTYPDCAGKTAYLYYWKYPATMTDDNDEHGLPFGGRDVLVTYALYKIWLNKDPERASQIKRLLNEQTEEYLEFVGQRRQASHNFYQSITFGDEMYDKEY